MSKRANRNESQLVEGDLIELECVAHNSRPAANISWFHGADRIELGADGMQIGAEPPTQFAGNGGDTSATQRKQSRQKRLLQRNQVQLNSDGNTYDTHSFLSVKLSRHENKAQISCSAANAAMRQPASKSLELQVQRK